MPHNPDRLYQGGYLPHCEGGGRPQLITTRLADSLPKSAYRRILAKAEDEAERRALAQRYLDGGRGACVLRHAEAASIIREALQFYDGDRYTLVDWVVMPNHIHFVYDNPTVPVGKICEDLKGYTASAINKVLGRSGKLWQRDYFDRYARDEGHLSNMCFYTVLNPVHAGLVDDPLDWPYSSVHDYPPKFKDDLRRWYRAWRRRFWNAPR